MLKTRGTLWINIGDGYAGGGNGGGGNYAAERANWRSVPPRSGQRGAVKGLKPKDRMMVPARLAIALQAAGWWLRDEIVWFKPNTMPESVVDRTTKAHESLFLFAKSGAPTCWLHEDGRWAFTRPPADNVWRNREQVEESATARTEKGWRRVNRWRGRDYYYDADSIMEPCSPDTHARAARGRSDKHKWADGPGNQTIARVAPSAGRKAVTHGLGIRSNVSFYAATTKHVTRRNKRSVWTIPTSSLSDPHYAAYPPALIEPCILAGCPKGGVVLDPFAGAGTTGLVAERLQRDSILIELNADYAKMARRRIRASLGVVRSDLVETPDDSGPLFLSAAAE